MLLSPKRSRELALLVFGVFVVLVIGLTVIETTRDLGALWGSGPGSSGSSPMSMTLEAGTGTIPSWILTIVEIAGVTLVVLARSEFGSRTMLAIVASVVMSVSLAHRANTADPRVGTMSRMGIGFVATRDHISMDRILRGSSSANTDQNLKDIMWRRVTCGIPAIGLAVVASWLIRRRSGQANSSPTSRAF